MLVSKYGKTYDDADGSEQRTEGAPAPAAPGAQRGGLIGRERWEDDGGPANDRPAPALAVRPSWSVLSLNDLNAAIRREARADDPAQTRADAARAEQRSASALQRAADGDAEAARAKNDRYRNAWEHT